jgi:dethiobiotin synthetase
MRCLAAARLSPPPDILCDLCPYLVAPPCSPHLAARDAETEIDLLRIHRAVKRVAKQADTVLVEGAGGVLVPLGGGMTMRDLMVELNLPVLLAARPGLGTLNHTLLSLQALEAAGLRPIGVVLVETEASNWGHIEDDNRHAIASLSGIPIVGRLPFCPQFPVGGALSPALCDAGDDIMRELDHCLDSQW